MLELTDLSKLADFSRGIDGLLPAIAQDAETGRVLMLAWMNQQALQETIQSRRAVYYSRSRQSLWRKGDTSGHHQAVKEIQVDCDRDSILLKVDQTGAACHEGYESCFFRRVNQAGDSLEVIEPRIVDPDQVYENQ